MSATGQRKSRSRAAYITSRTPARGVGMDREAMLHERRKTAMISLLSEFEREIEPHLDGVSDTTIKNFKTSCREKLNGLTFEAIELMRLRPGERLNEHSVDLAAQLPFDDNGGIPQS